MMRFDEKLPAYRAHMLAQQIKPSTSTPLLWRALWKLGARLPPPHFLAFVPLVLICGAFFGIFWGLTMYLLLWRAQAMPLPIVFGAPLLAGLLFGLVMAGVFRRQARRLELTSWQDWTPPH